MRLKVCSHNTLGKTWTINQLIGSTYLTHAIKHKHLLTFNVGIHMK